MTVTPFCRSRENSKRYRMRRARGQAVYYLSANSERLINFLVRKGLLPDDVVHSHAEIELALAHWVDDETK
jgi:hypothetical protein